MTLTKNKKTGIYHASFVTPQGKRKSITTRSTDLKTARQVVKDSNMEELEAAAKAARLTTQVIGQLTTGKKMTNEKAMAEWAKWMGSIGRSAITVKTMAGYLAKFLRDAGLEKQPPSVLTEEHMNAFVNDEKSMSKRTSRGVRLAAVRGFTKYCSAKGWIAGDPGRLVTVNNTLLSHKQKEVRVRVPFTDDEIGVLLNACEVGTFWHAAITIGRYMGLRIGDICTLEWDCFAKPGVAVVWTDKRDARVELPLSPPSLVTAISAIPIDDSIYCFPKQNRIMNSVTQRSTLSKQFTRLAESLGIYGKSFHCLRHTYCTACHLAGIPTPHIQQRMGHANPEMTAHYIH